MTTKERVAGWAGVAILIATAAWAITTDGVAHLIWIVWLGCTSLLSIWTANWAADYLFRNEQRLEELVEQARGVGDRTGLRITIATRGRLFTVTVVLEIDADHGTVALLANPSPHGEVRAWLAGIDAGHRLTREEL